jgi:hypothetical protein
VRGPRQALVLQGDFCYDLCVSHALPRLSAVGHLQGSMVTQCQGVWHHNTILPPAEECIRQAGPASRLVKVDNDSSAYTGFCETMLW